MANPYWEDCQAYVSYDVGLRAFDAKVVSMHRPYGRA